MEFAFSGLPSKETGQLYETFFIKQSKSYYQLCTQKGTFPINDTKMLSSRYFITGNSTGTIYSEASMSRLHRTKTRIAPCFPQVQAVTNNLEDFKNGERFFLPFVL